METRTNTKANGSRTKADAYLKKTLVDASGNSHIIEGANDEWLFAESKQGEKNVVASAMIAKQEEYLVALSEYEALDDDARAETEAPVEPTFTLECRLHIPAQRPVAEVPQF